MDKNLRAAKYKNTVRIAILGSFEKIGWRKKENWGWNPNLTKIIRIN
jgi:hypothetical protein